MSRPPALVIARAPAGPHHRSPAAAQTGRGPAPWRHSPSPRLTVGPSGGPHPCLVTSPGGGQPGGPGKGAVTGSRDPGHVNASGVPGRAGPGASVRHHSKTKINPGPSAKQQPYSHTHPAGVCAPHGPGSRPGGRGWQGASQTGLPRAAAGEPRRAAPWSLFTCPMHADDWSFFLCCVSDHPALKVNA